MKVGIVEQSLSTSGKNGQFLKVCFVLLVCSTICCWFCNAETEIKENIDVSHWVKIWISKEENDPDYNIVTFIYFIYIIMAPTDVKMTVQGSISFCYSVKYYSDILCMRLFFPPNLQWTQMMRWGATQASYPLQHPHRLVRMGRRLGAPLHSLHLCQQPCLELGRSQVTTLMNKNKQKLLNVACIVDCFSYRWFMFSFVVLRVRAVRWWGSR